MGRAFEFRKARKLKRWGNMSRVFTKLGKDIEIAVKAGGPDPAGNARLRLLIQTARSENMPKDNVERAIKRAISKDSSDYKEVVYEGYAPHGVAVVVETATDNTTRTVANVRSCFNKWGGSLGTMGMTDFLFDRKCSFKVALKEGIDLEDLELELIDFGLDEIFTDEGEIMIYAEFTKFGPIQKYLEDNKFEIKAFAFERIPNDTKELNPEQQADVEKLLEKLEEDDDVINVFHNMR
ncbi:MAG: YebC/PmpR family DNA-binding transcriptional regulator [Bacteroidales bacterium]|nr:YebC/PmpR family DNA-binding transcriptional regulator [Bacteroidales bacterium]MBK7171651.1 YebC/PmpR family DNA-binding transcriptional regulator [Bacteroidales bacterium]